MFGHGPAGVEGDMISPHQSETFVHAKAQRTGSRSFLSTEEPMNNVKTMVLMAGLLGLFLLAGQLLGGSQGFMLALVVGSAFNFIMYFFSDKLVLRMYGAQVV